MNSQYLCTTAHVTPHTMSSDSSSGNTAVPLELLNSNEVHLLHTPPVNDCPQTTFIVPYKTSACTYRKHLTWSLSTVVWCHCPCRSVFTEPLLRNRLHNPTFLLLRACITYIQLFLRLTHSCIKKICHSILVWHVECSMLCIYKGVSLLLTICAWYSWEMTLNFSLNISISYMQDWKGIWKKVGKLIVGKFI
jgi:hypothetical protein